MLPEETIYILSFKKMKKYCSIPKIKLVGGFCPLKTIILDQDTFSFSTIRDVTANTRRSILSVMSSLYDRLVWLRQ